MRDFLDNTFWKFLSTLWGVLYLALALADFFGKNPYEYVLGPLGTVYIASLGIFVGSKEFDRWHERHPGKRRGEIFVVLFSVVMVLFFVVSFATQGEYEVTPDIVATYIAILSVFVISQKSKELYGEKKTKREEK